MYEQLVQLLNQYLVMGTTTGTANSYYRGKLIQVNPETFEMELLTPEGTLQGRHIGLTPSVTKIQTNTRELIEMSLRINYLMSVDEEVGIPHPLS